jgi:hypothetical protein
MGDDQAATVRAVHHQVAVVIPFVPKEAAGDEPAVPITRNMSIRRRHHRLRPLDSPPSAVLNPQGSLATAVTNLLKTLGNQTRILTISRERREIGRSKKGSLSAALIIFDIEENCKSNLWRASTFLWLWPWASVLREIFPYRLFGRHPVAADLLAPDQPTAHQLAQITG